jgi:hypothetical protein
MLCYVHVFDMNVFLWSVSLTRTAGQNSLFYRKVLKCSEICINA